MERCSEGQSCEQQLNCLHGSPVDMRITALQGRCGSELHKPKPQTQGLALLKIVATGLGLFLDASMKQTAGVVLLGLAATSLIGSLGLRTLWFLSSVVVSGIGIFITAKPILEEWESFRSSSEVYARGLSDLHVAILLGRSTGAILTRQSHSIKSKGNSRQPTLPIMCPFDSIRYWQQFCSDFVTDVTPGRKTNMERWQCTLVMTNTKKWLIPLHCAQLVKVKAAVASLSKLSSDNVQRRVIQRSERSGARGTSVFIVNRSSYITEALTISFWFLWRDFQPYLVAVSTKRSAVSAGKMVGSPFSD